MMSCTFASLEQFSETQVVYVKATAEFRTFVCSYKSRVVRLRIRMFPYILMLVVIILKRLIHGRNKEVSFQTA